ncbi:MAG: N5-carboxyaminoimidazole ribonucleotide mutase [Prochlorococcus marinus str. MIT 9215]|nr:MAG: N5-carboxyaminoimidazole ribonucleotide mutase [Prochlorococcus marinus str. MIT 9215]
MTDQHARLDLQRRQRIGMVEAIFGEFKTSDQIAAILKSFQAAGELALVTRIDQAKADHVAHLLQAVPQGIRPSETLPQANQTQANQTQTKQPQTNEPQAIKPKTNERVANQQVANELQKQMQFHASARCLTVGVPPLIKAELGEVLVLSGGTSDLAVAAEAELALRWHGVQSEMLLDVGVAGLQRLLAQITRLQRAKVLIVCAGMEGALPTVVAGLVSQPVIGVPISVGYGVSAGGRTALEGMLASCAPGLVVVNIDNGYGAAMAALRILNLRT